MRAININPKRLREVCESATSNKDAAEQLEIHVDTLLYKCDKYGITRPNVRLKQKRGWATANKKKTKKPLPYPMGTIRLTLEEYNQRRKKEADQQKEADQKQRASGQPPRLNLI